MSEREREHELNHHARVVQCYKADLLLVLIPPSTPSLSLPAVFSPRYEKLATAMAQQKDTLSVAKVDATTDKQDEALADKVKFRVKVFRSMTLFQSIGLVPPSV